MKRIMIMATVMLMVLVMAACSKKENPVTGYKDGDVVLGEYKGIKYTPSSAEVTEEELLNRLDTEFIQKNLLNVDITDRDEVADGDYVDIDYTGYRDGVAFEGGSEKGRELKIGSKTFIDGFESGLIGKKKGEDVTIETVFPDPYPNNPDMAGVKTVFEIKINNIFQKVEPELTDELIKEKTSYSTLEEYKNKLREDILTTKQQTAETQRQSDIIEKAVVNATFVKDLTELIAKKRAEFVESYESMAKSYYNIDAKSMYRIMYGMSEQEYEEYMDAMAKANVEVTFVLSAIADAENIAATEDEINSEIAAMLEQSEGKTEEDLMKSIKETYNVDGRDYIGEQIKLIKAQEFIISNAIAE